MRFPGSFIIRLALIIPALVIAYFGYLYLSGSVGDPTIDFLGTGAAQEKKAQQQTTKGSGEVAADLSAKVAELNRREEAVARREQELAVLERDLLRMRREIASERTKLETDKAEFERREKERNSARITQIANTLKNTKSNVAAAQLIALYRRNRTTALYVLSQLDSRSAGKIFSKVGDSDLAAKILEDFEAWRVEQDAAIDSTSNPQN